MERFIGQNGIGTAGHPAAAGYAALTAHNSSRQGRAQLLLLALERRSPRARDDAAWLKEATGRTRTIVFSGITLAFLQRRTAPFFAEPDQQATITHYQALGLDRIIVKNGGKRIVLSDHCAIRRIETVPVAAVVDSTSAGDSRNGAFWHDSPRLAVRWRRRITPPHVASIVTGRHGASIESTALSVLPGFNPPA